MSCEARRTVPRTYISSNELGRTERLLPASFRTIQLIQDPPNRSLHLFDVIRNHPYS